MCSPVWCVARVNSHAHVCAYAWFSTTTVDSATSTVVMLSKGGYVLIQNTQQKTVLIVEQHRVCNIIFQEQIHVC